MMKIKYVIDKNFSQGVRRKTQGTEGSLQKLAFESEN